jgi:Na+-translocating ferredoxin:NAD+ oxidoreductase RnfE subunit
MRVHPFAQTRLYARDLVITEAVFCGLSIRPADMTVVQKINRVISAFRDLASPVALPVATVIIRNCGDNV